MSNYVGYKSYIRPITLDDTGLIVKWRNQDNVRQFFFYREDFTREIHEKWMREKVATGAVVQFVVHYNEDNRPIGSTYLRDINRDEGTAEYGVFLGDETVRGQGIGEEVLELTLDYAWEELGLNKVIARVIDGNIPSIRSFLHVGFKQEEIIRSVQCSDGVIVDMVMLSITRENK